MGETVLNNPNYMDANGDSFRARNGFSKVGAAAPKWMGETILIDPKFQTTCMQIETVSVLGMVSPKLEQLSTVHTSSTDPMLVNMNRITGTTKRGRMCG
jgi:hypothetical protein